MQKKNMKSRQKKGVNTWRTQVSAGAKLSTSKRILPQRELTGASSGGSNLLGLVLLSYLLAFHVYAYFCLIYCLHV